jgi:hypothetical protein
MRWFAALSSALAFAQALGLAYASPVSEERHRLASESFRQAQAAFGRREYAAAAAAFEQAARFEPHPSPLLDAEEAWELAGEPVHASEDCDLVLAMPGVEVRFSNEAKRRLKALSTKVSTLEVQGPRTTTVRLDGGADIVLPMRRRLTPGRHELTIVDLQSSRTKTMSLDLTPGEARALDVADAFAEEGRAADLGSPRRETQTAASATTAAPASLPALSSIDSMDSGSTPSRVPLTTWVALGACAVSVGVAVGFGLATVSEKRSYSMVPAPSTADAFHRDKLITNVAWGVAAASAVTALVAWLMAPEPTWEAADH